MLSPTHAKFMWASIRNQMALVPAGTFIRYPKTSLPHPREAGAVPSFGLPVGQSADFRFPPDEACRGVHVHEYPDAWVVHVDRVHPACDAAEHVRVDAPQAWAVGGAALGGLLGAALSKKPEGFVVGTALGLLLGALTGQWREEREAKPSPR